jgi:hypothetical protein
MSGSRRHVLMVVTSRDAVPMGEIASALGARTPAAGDGISRRALGGNFVTQYVWLREPRRTAPRGDFPDARFWRFSMSRELGSVSDAGALAEKMRRQRRRRQDAIQVVRFTTHWLGYFLQTWQKLNTSSDASRLSQR